MHPQILKDESIVINELHAGIAEKLKSSVSDAIGIGNRLSTVKKFLAHGEFLDWIDQNCIFSDRTARRYMSLYEYSDKLASVSDLQEAYQQIETLEQQEKKSEFARQKERVNHFLETGEKLEGWKRGTDDKEAEKTKQERSFQREKIDELKKENEQKRIDREKQESEERINREVNDKIINDFFAKASKHAHLNLSGYADNMNQQDMFLAIERYINSFNDVSRQLEATHNLIKKMKLIASELQVKSGEGVVA